MHYIIGTEILVQGKTIGQIRPGMTSQQLRERSTGSSRWNEHRKLFQPDTVYVLTRVCMIDAPDGTRQVSYIFNETHSDGERVTANFSDSLEADSFISELLDEVIPNYDLFHEERTD